MTKNLHRPFHILNTRNLLKYRMSPRSDGAADVKNSIQFVGQTGPWTEEERKQVACFRLASGKQVRDASSTTSEHW